MAAVAECQLPDDADKAREVFKPLTTRLKQGRSLEDIGQAWRREDMSVRIFPGLAGLIYPGVVVFI
jgi:hypothetical protein